MIQKKDKKSDRKEAAAAAKTEKSEKKEEQTFNVIGKIDLDQFKKPAKGKTAKPSKAEKAEAKPAKKEEKPAPQPVKEEPKPVKEEPKKEKAEPQKPQETPKPEAPKPAEKPAPAPESKPVEAKEPAKEEGITENGAFRLEHNKKPSFTVLGKIDLSAINQSTRPKKKSKEEKKKEREENTQQARDQKKKRARIGKERVDINDVANQPKKNKGGNNGGQNANANAGNQGNNKKSKKKNRRSNQPQEVNEEDVARQVKETLARLTNKQTQNKKGAKYRKDKRDAAAEQRDAAMAAEAAESKVLKLTEYVTVSELATMMDVPVTKLIGTLMSIGVMVSINQRLDAETINMVAEEFGFSTEYVSAEVQNAITEEADDEVDLVERAPIVTVMGHVDHGKTSLLDYVRNTNVIAGEAGGITQHIGAYNVKLADGRRITFLDTPGHEAFTAMRARGTQVTDIAIIIIAADDSVMPTTKEAIAHAQAANVPMVFAINKIDKPGANPDKIREDLAQMNLLVEDWGGKYQCQEISAKSGLGVDELMEKVLLEAEMLELEYQP